MSQQIIALIEISLSELYKSDNKYTELYASEERNGLKSVLYSVGVDTSQFYETQFNTHRNRFNEVYTGTRFVGLERMDEQWIKSGYASRAVIDKAKGSSLLTDLYARKGLTTSSTGKLWESESEVKEGV